jgi:hypothetical protein
MRSAISLPAVTSAPLSNFCSIDTVLSRRSVRRHNAVVAREFVPVRTDDIASLLPQP